MLCRNSYDSNTLKARNKVFPQGAAFPSQFCNLKPWSQLITSLLSHSPSIIREYLALTKLNSNYKCLWLDHGLAP